MDKLDQVVNYLNFIQNIKSNEALNLLNCELISKANSAIRARKNRRKGDEEEE